MKRSHSVLAGIALAMLGLWGGAYLADYFAYSDWRRFPSLITALLIFVTGMGLAVIGVAR